MDSPASITVDNVTEDQLASFKEAFEAWDQADSLSVTDLKQIFQSVGLNVDSEELRGIEKDVDYGGESGGAINFPKLLDAIGKTLQNGFTDTEQDLLEAFRLFDPQKTGFVDVNELKPLLMTIGDRTEAEATEMLAIADEQKTGKIRYYTFVKSMFMR